MLELDTEILVMEKINHQFRWHVYTGCKIVDMFLFYIPVFIYFILNQNISIFICQSLLAQVFSLLISPLIRALS